MLKLYYLKIEYDLKLNDSNYYDIKLDFQSKLLQTKMS